MLRALFYIAAFIVVVHGLIHLLGLVAYWPLAPIAELPYKTTLANGRLQLTPNGMRAYSVLWLLVAAGIGAGVAGLLLEQPWWLPLLSGAVLLSLLITALDWQNAYVGTVVSGVLLLLLLVIWGLRVQPAPLPALPAPASPVEYVGLPANLPPPVARFYRVLGDTGVVRMAPEAGATAVFHGRGTLRFNGITFPMRLRIAHLVGQAYWHDIEATFWGVPIMTAHEAYVNGQARMETPAGVMENSPKVDEAANMVLWSEALLFPALLVQDEQVQWLPRDANSGWLVVPGPDEPHQFAVTFDPETGFADSISIERYRGEELNRTLWTIGLDDWGMVDGHMVPTMLAVTWADEGTPWFVCRIEGTAYNVRLNGLVEP